MNLTVLLWRQSFVPVATKHNQTVLYTMCWSLAVERAQCWFRHVGEGSRFGNSCLIRLMAPQVFTLSEQRALYSFKVDYAIMRCKFTNVWYISMQITDLCK